MKKKILLAVGALSFLLFFYTCAPEQDGATRIGCVLSTTGLLGPKGLDRLNAARLAVDEINASGGISGKQVKLLEGDDATDPAKSLERISKMVTADNLKVLVGGMSSGAVMAAGPFLAEKQVLMVSPSATASQISDQPWTDWVYRTAPQDALQGRILARVVHNRGFKRLATMVQANDYGIGLENSLLLALERAGWTGKHVVAAHFDPQQNDYRTELDNIRSSAPDVILAVTYIEDGIRIFTQASQMRLDEIAWLGCDGNYSEHMFVDPKCAQFMEKALVAGTRTVAPSDMVHGKFAEAYKAAFGKEPSVYCDNTYDAVKMIAMAIEKANMYDGGAIRDALFGIGQGYHGASGIITFDEKGDRASGIFEIWKVARDLDTASGYKNVRVDLISIM